MHRFFLLLFLTACTLPGTQPEVTYTPPIPFAPETYRCYRIPSPIEIDGRLTESAWTAAPPTADFVDIEGARKPLPPYQTYAKMLWDDSCFYVAAYLEEPHIWGTLTQRDAVIFHDNDFELFIDPDGDTHHYYEFEMNALNTIWDLLLLKPYREPGGPKVLDSWDIRGIRTAVHIEGTLNDPSDEDRYWSVEVAIPWKVLEEMAPEGRAPADGEQWRVNFSRVNWHMDIRDGNYHKRLDPSTGRQQREENWVWSPTGYINMHMPETWGYVQFSDSLPDHAGVPFRTSPEEEVKWALRLLYYQQGAYHETHQAYAPRLSLLTVPEVPLPGYRFTPQLHTFPGGYLITAPMAEGAGYWTMSEDGRVGRQ